MLLELTPNQVQERRPPWAPASVLPRVEQGLRSGTISGTMISGMSPDFQGATLVDEALVIFLPRLRSVAERFYETGQESLRDLLGASECRQLDDWMVGELAALTLSWRRLDAEADRWLSKLRAIPEALRLELRSRPVPLQVGTVFRQLTSHLTAAEGGAAGEAECGIAGASAPEENCQPKRRPAPEECDMPRINRPDGFRDLAHYTDALSDRNHPEHQAAMQYTEDHGQWWKCLECTHLFFDVSCTTSYVLEGFGVDEDSSRDDPEVKRLATAMYGADPDLGATKESADPLARRCGYCEDSIREAVERALEGDEGPHP